MTSDDRLAALGRDEATRARIVEALREYEMAPERRFTTVRDDITGPIADALHRDVPLIRKQLRGGLVFEFPYRSKIARDFVLALPERPDHVWEPQTTKALLHLARDGSDVIVGGAYFGDQAILIADALRGRGVCHAFEPDSFQASALERNAELNGLENVRVHSLALWSEAGVSLRFEGADAVATMRPADEGVATTTIDGYAHAAGLQRVSIIMLDLEGSELEVLRGAERVLREHAPSVVFEVHRSYVDWDAGLAATDIVRLLSSHQYTVFAIRDFQSNIDLGDRPVELVPLDGVVLDGPPHGFNLLAVHDPSIVQHERFRITPNVSPKLLLHRDPALHHPGGGL